MLRRVAVLLAALPVVSAAGHEGRHEITLNHTVLGEVKSVCDGDHMFLEIPQANYANLNGVVEDFAFSIEVPEECAPYNHVFATYNTIGHPPWDGQLFVQGGTPGGWGVPHLDIHFMLPTVEEREVETSTCSIIPPIQCNASATDEQTQRFFNLPHESYMTGFYEDKTFGGHAVIMHGMHLTDLKDQDGVAHCTSTGPNGNWVDCLNQQLSFIVDGGPVVDYGCRCGVWDDGVSSVLNVFDGHVIGYEIMPTVSHALDMLGDSLPNPYYEDFPRQDLYEVDIRPPIATYSRIHDGVVHLGLKLDSEPVLGCAMDCPESPAHDHHHNDHMYRRHLRGLKFGSMPETCGGC